MTAARLDTLNNMEAEPRVGLTVVCMRFLLYYREGKLQSGGEIPTEVLREGPKSITRWISVVGRFSYKQKYNAWRIVYALRDMTCP